MIVTGLNNNQSTSYAIAVTKTANNKQVSWRMHRH